MSYYGQAQHVPDTLALVPWADMMRHSSEAGETKAHGKVQSLGGCVRPRKIGLHLQWVSFVRNIFSLPLPLCHVCG